MAAQKTYFVIPGLFEEFRDNLGTDPNERIKFSLVSYQIAGVQQLINFPVSAGVIDTDLAELSNCDSDFSNCALGGLPNSYNPFYNYLFFDFPIVNGVARGASTGVRGTAPVSDYGYNSLNLTIDKNEVIDGFGNSRKGAFAIDIDYDQDFYLKINIQANPTAASKFFYGEQLVVEIAHNAETCSSTYTVNSTTTGLADVFFYGFLKGETEENEAGEYHIIPSCFEIPPVDVCLGYKTKSIGLLVRVPVVLSPIAIKESCCTKLDVFAEQGSPSENWKNDFKSLLYKRQTENDIFTFKLLSCGDEIVLDDDTLGTFYNYGDFEDYPDYTAFILDWNKVLNNGNLGEGTYQLKVEYDIAGATGSFLSCIYDLKIYDPYRADRTVRIEAEMNGYLEQFDINYKGLNFRDCVRIPGFFGLMQPEGEKDSLVYKNRENIPVKISDVRDYTLSSELLDECVTKHLTDWIFKADRLYISDFNILNHRSDFKDFPVQPPSPSDVDFNYPSLQRGAIMTATFNDLFDDKRKLSC